MKTKEQRLAIRNAIELKLQAAGRYYTNAEINNFDDEEARNAIRCLRHSINETRGNIQYLSDYNAAYIKNMEAEIRLIQDVHAII